MKKKKQVTLMDLTFKNMNTVGDLKKLLNELDDNEPLLMASDGEGNEINKILYLELYVEGLIFYPWEPFPRT